MIRNGNIKLEIHADKITRNISIESLLISRLSTVLFLQCISKTHICIFHLGILQNQKICKKFSFTILGFTEATNSR
jgi:hypothetical protein